MKPNPAVFLAATATAANAQQQYFDTFGECQAACSVADGCRSAAYSAVSKQCNTYSCILSQLFEPPEGIQIYRPSGSQDFRFCPQEIPLPATTVVSSTVTATSTSPDATTSGPGATTTPDPGSGDGDGDGEDGDDEDCGDYSGTFTTLSHGTSSYIEENTSTTAATSTPYLPEETSEPEYPSSGSEGDDGGCVEGVPGCGNGNYTSSAVPNAASPSTDTDAGAPDPTATVVEVSGGGKIVVEGFLPAFGLVAAAVAAGVMG